MKRLNDKRRKYIQRKKRIRKKLQGTAECPRMTVTKSLKNISVQVIDDTTGKTLAAASTLEKDLRGITHTVEGGKLIGAKIGERLGTAKVKAVVFDRNGYAYHGIVKAVAEGAREAGIKF